MIKSPSKHISLKRLKQIRKDNFIGEGGQEYCPFEIEALIVEKEQKQAMELVSKAQSMTRVLAKTKAVNEAIDFKRKQIEKLSFTLDMKAESFGKTSVQQVTLFDKILNAIKTELAIHF